MTVDWRERQQRMLANLRAAWETAAPDAHPYTFVADRETQPMEIHVRETRETRETDDEMNAMAQAALDALDGRNRYGYVESKAYGTLRIERATGRVEILTMRQRTHDGKGFLTWTPSVMESDLFPERFNPDGTRQPAVTATAAAHAPAEKEDKEDDAISF